MPIGEQVISLEKQGLGGPVVGCEKWHLKPCANPEPF